MRASTLRAALRRRIGEAALVLKSGEISDEAIHVVRKKLKSARATLRLLRDAAGRTAYVRENAALRDAARPLSAVRDSRAMLDTVNALLERKAGRGRRLVLTGLRGRLVETHAAARAQFEGERRGGSSARALQRASQRIARWGRVRGGRAALARSIERVYRKARKALRAVEAERSPENFHELRKQAKYLHEALAPLESDVIPPPKVVQRAGRIATLLGEDHDLHMLDEHVAAAEATGRANAARVRTELVRRRAKLESRALKLARKLLRRVPRSFAKRLSI